MKILDEVKEIQKSVVKKRGRKSKSELNKGILSELHKKYNPEELVENEVQRRSRGYIKRIKNKVERKDSDGNIRIIDQLIETDMEDCSHLINYSMGI